MISVKDVILDIMKFFIYVAVTFGWVLMVLLIISFIGQVYLHWRIDGMMIAAGVCAAAMAVWYIIKMVIKYNRLLNKEK